MDSHNIDSHNVSVHILDKIYQIKCPQDSVQSLQDAAIYVDKKMREIRDKGKVVDRDRAAVGAALNIAHEFLNIEQKENKKMSMMAERINEMHQHIEEVFVQSDQAELL